MSKYFSLFIMFLSFYNCKKSTQKVTDIVEKSDRNIVANHKTTSKVNTTSLKKIESWKEYTTFKEFFKRFEKISPDEAFDNISELKDLTLALEDSLNISLFKNNAFKSRLHVLENEVMRLHDMQDIPAITSNEVNLQIDKIFLVFTSLNDKINTVFNQENIEKKLNSDIFFTMDKEELIEPKNPVKTIKPLKKVKNKRSLKNLKPFK